MYIIKIKVSVKVMRLVTSYGQYFKFCGGNFFFVHSRSFTDKSTWSLYLSLAEVKLLFNVRVDGLNPRWDTVDKFFNRNV